MAASPTISLFTQRIDDSRRPASFLASFAIHCGAIALVWFGIAYTPRINTHVVTEHYAVRHLDLRTPEQLARRSKALPRYPGPRLVSAKSGAGNRTPPPAMRQIAHAQPGPQTLIQPDIPDQVALKQEVPVPMVVLWTPSKTTVKNIVAPQPEKPTASDVTPTLERPNDELNLSDVDLAASKLPSPKLPVMPSTTSPVVVHAPELTQLAPQTASQPTAQPTPATVMSLSDLQMKEGAVTLPPVNETASTTVPGDLAPGTADKPSAPGDGNAAGTGSGSGTGTAPSPDAAAAEPAAAPQGQPALTQSAAAPAAEAANGQSYQPSATAITLPRDGRFGAVVVGNALEDQFPEMASVWSGRMAYTVYLHVGLARSWILQYSLPRSDDASSAGNVAHIDAPWPYNIVRPNLQPGAIEADALMVHGFVNPSGRFETLSVVFPQTFPQAEFVLSSLQQWQFRPAMQNGAGARVEVLLIIPEELN